MKRPFIPLGFAALGALALASLIGPEHSPLAAAICAVPGVCALILSLLLKRRLSVPGNRRAFFRSCLPAVSLALLAAAFSLFRYGLSAGDMLAAEALCEKGLRVRGTVLDYPTEERGKAIYELRIDRVLENGIEKEAPRFTARISARQPIPCGPGDTLECDVRFYRFSNTGGLYSVRDRFWAKGAAVGGYVTGYGSVNVVPCTGFPPGKLLAELRRQIGRRFEALLPGDDAGFVRAILLGERDLISDETYRDFKTAGVSHLLVISGMHLSALASLIAALLKRLCRNRLARNLATGLCLGFFLGLIAFPVSAVRSGVMLLMYLVADTLGTKPDGLNSLGIAVFVICLVNPFSGGDLGFALSVCATLGIILWAERIYRSLLRPVEEKPGAARILRPVFLSLSVTLAALAGTLPIQLAVFGGLSLMGILGNLLLVFPCTMMMYAAFAGGALGLLPLPGLNLPFVFLAGGLVRFSAFIARELARTPGAFVSLHDPGTLLGVLLTGGIILLLRRMFRARRISCAALAVAILLAGCAFRTDPGTVTLAAVRDSGCVVVMKNGTAAVLALGGYRTGAVCELLSRCNIRRVECLCMPVRTREAREAAVTLLETYGAERLAVPDGAYVGLDLALAGRKAERVTLRDGDPFTVLDDLYVSVSCGMQRITLFAGGTEIIVETGDTGAGSCGVLFTDRKNSRINSPFTVLQSDAIIEYDSSGPEAEQLAELPAGCCVLPGANGLFIDLTPGGEIRLRGDSLCPSWEDPN